jgi:hypothetical protein
MVRVLVRSPTVSTRQVVGISVAEFRQAPDSRRDRHRPMRDGCPAAVHLRQLRIKRAEVHDVRRLKPEHVCFCRKAPFAARVNQTSVITPLTRQFRVTSSASRLLVTHSVSPGAQSTEVGKCDGASGNFRRQWIIRLRVADRTSGLHGDEHASGSQVDLDETPKGP